MARPRTAGAKSPDGEMDQNDTRLALLRDWLTSELGWRPERVEPASSDASFRRYFRAFRASATFIVMDAPPEKEDVRPYLKVTRLLETIGVHVPHVQAADVARGLVLLEDLGDTLYLDRLHAGDDPDKLYGAALAALLAIQTRGQEAARELPPYDAAALTRELALMPEWFYRRHLELELTTAERGIVEATFEFLTREALAQPAVFVHRDFHSRNLMVLPERGPGILDFQDALCGPIGYDLVSLLKDCYIGWPRDRVVRWVEQYRTLLRSRGGEAGGSDTEFLRWFDLVGVQRHLKVLGIFARLWYRDGKIRYLSDLPLILEYVRDTCDRYPELAGLAELLRQRVIPRLAPANAREEGRARK